MQRSKIRILAASFAMLVFLSACHATTRSTAAHRKVLQSDANAAARTLFTSHYGFYHENPSLHKPLLTPEFFKALKRDYDACIITGRTGALDSDPWTGAQDGAVSEPFLFETLEYKNAEATIRLNYTFTNGPKNAHKQSVLLKLKREGPDSNWKLADFITPDQKSLIDLLESNP